MLVQTFPGNIAISFIDKLMMKNHKHALHNKTKALRREIGTRLRRVFREFREKRGRGSSAPLSSFVMLNEKFISQ